MKKLSTRIGLLGLLALPLAGCSRDNNFAPVDMWNRSRLKPYEPVNFFDNGNSSRPLVAGTIARGQLRAEWFTSGTEGGRYLTQIPAEISKTYARRVLLDRGRERFNIYCTPCHGETGYGDGVVVKRGFNAPPSYHIPRLRQAPVGHFYDVISNGYGTMYSYAARVSPEDRWAIAEYIRVLQRSQNATLNDVPANLRGELRSKGVAGLPEAKHSYVYPETSGGDVVKPVNNKPLAPDASVKPESGAGHMSTQGAAHGNGAATNTATRSQAGVPVPNVRQPNAPKPVPSPTAAAGRNATGIQPAGNGRRATGTPAPRVAP